jgi:putative oxidoreductase
MTTDIQAAARRRSGATHLALWGLQIALSAAFLGAGGAKLAGMSAMVQMFDQIGAGQWFRLFTGFTEVAVALALLHPRHAAHAATLLGLTMLCAALTHLLLIGGSAWPAMVLGAASAVVAIGRRTSAQAPAPAVTN